MNIHPNPRRRFAMLIAGSTLALAVTVSGCSVTGVSGGGDSGDGTGTVKALFMKQAGYTEQDYAAIIGDFEAEHPDIDVEPTFVSYEALHDKIVTSAPSGSYDVVLIDVIWPAEFASKGIIADLTDRSRTSGVTRCCRACSRPPSIRTGTTAYRMAPPPSSSTSTRR